MHNIPIKEQFNHPQGHFEDYDAYDTAQRFGLARQQHVDLRTFDSREVRSKLTMLHLNTLTMNQLNGATMNDLAGDVIIRKAERWTQGILDFQADRNNTGGLTLELAAGTNVTSSTIKD